ncbi:MAG: hypothetical protein HYZ89_05425 [Candidatus Omnitrophica bacterium]|nr:hypothetical protein [Candidatus Omnitrophota bacterium]
MSQTMVKPHSCFRIVDRSKTRAPSCLKQLTVWVRERAELQFAIDQLNKYEAPWVLKRDRATGQFAVFIPGQADYDASE